MACPNNQLKLQNKVEDLQGVQQEGMDIFDTKRINGNLGTGTKQSVTSGYIEAAKTQIVLDEAAAKVKARAEQHATVQYDLAASGTNTTIVVKRNGVTVTPGSDVLYGGDKIVATATPAEGYDLTTFTLNTKAYTANKQVEVNSNMTFAATSTIKKFDLARTATDCTIAVTRGGSTITDGTEALSYGDTLTITATAGEGKVMDTLTVNGAAFTSGSTIVVKDDITIVGTAVDETPEVEETQGE